MQALPKPKIRLLNLDIHQFSYRERLIHSKRHLKRSLCIEFKENPLSHFSSRESLPKLKIGRPNLDQHKIFCCKRLIHPKRHLKRSLCIEFLKNHQSHSLLRGPLLSPKFGYQIWTPINFSVVNNYYTRKDIKIGIVT